MIKEYKSSNGVIRVLNGDCVMVGDWGKIKADDKNRLEYFYDTFREYSGYVNRVFGVVHYRLMKEENGERLFKTVIAEYSLGEDGIICQPHTELIITNTSNYILYRLVSNEEVEDLTTNFTRLEDRKPINVFDPGHVIAKNAINIAIDTHDDEPSLM